MISTYQNGYPGEMESLGEQSFAETPFINPALHEQEEPHETEAGESLSGNWEFTTPFLPGHSPEASESETTLPEVAAFAEITAELKDSLFREALEQLADEALEANESALAGEYGDHESRNFEAERVLNEHFQPLAAEAEAMLDRFFERLESYEAESLTDQEISRIANEVMPTGTPLSPASEQFLGGLLRKAGRLVSGAVNLAKRGVEGAVKLAGKGLSVLGKLALGPLLKPLKMLGIFLLKHVVRFALGNLPPALRPIGQRLSERLFRSLRETNESEGEGEGENEDHEQMEAEVVPAARDAAHLEAEFDVQAAQLLLVADEAESEYLVSAYGESESYTSSLNDLDQARTRFVTGVAKLESGESVQPVMEQFLPAIIWPAAKTAITILGRPKLVNFLGGLLGKLVTPLIGQQASSLLAPAIADAGLRIFGLETANLSPRTMAAEALAATVEQTVHGVAELPPHVLENETLLAEAVNEAFEQAASSYFPNSIIKSELRESRERHGRWSQMPSTSRGKRYAKYSDAQPVDISPRVAASVETFGRSTLADNLRDQYGASDDRPYKGNVTLYQALPGTRGSTIARAEGFPANQLHPLTPQAAGALLGPNAALGLRAAPLTYLATPQRLHVNQRLYRIEPPHTGRRHHVRPVHSELAINLQRGEIRLWIYLSEPLCQAIATDLARGNSATAAFTRIRPLLRRTTEVLKLAVMHRHLPPEITVVSEVPNLRNHVPNWFRNVGFRLGARISHWSQVQLAQYLRNNAEEFKRACASRHDGLTLRMTMTRVPGLAALLRWSRGLPARELMRAGWPSGSPAFHVVLRPGYAIHRLRD